MVDVRDEEAARDEYCPFVDLDHCLLQGVERKTPLRAFIEMDDAVFHERVKAMIGDAGHTLCNAVPFHGLSANERVLEVFGCEAPTLARMMEALKLSLTLELAPFRALAGCERAEWHPWNVEDGIEAFDGGWFELDVPQSLRKSMERIGRRLGCAPRTRWLRGDGNAQPGQTERRDLAIKWREKLLVEAERPSAPEAMEAGIRLKELLR